MCDKVNRFDFTQFRFIIAAILLLAAGLKAYQLATSPLPPVVQDSLFTPLLELFNNRYLLMGVVVGEMLFAFVLIAGIEKQWTWLLSLLAFIVFAFISLMKGLSGESSCGCFGTVTINPWITMGFDLLIVTLLLVFRERFDWSLPSLDKRKILTVSVIWFILAGTSLFFMLSLKESSHATLGTILEGFGDKSIMRLAPELWKDKIFPLSSRFIMPNDSDILLKGMWTVLLIHTDCKRCLQLMKDLEEQNTERVVIVVVPSQPNEEIPDTDFPIFVLDNNNDWFAETPCIIRLNDGVCVEVR
jgi:hypothetical protein